MAVKIVFDTRSEYPKCPKCGNPCNIIIDNVFMPYIEKTKENNMKKSELSFKCVVPNSREENNLFRALKKIGAGDSDHGAGWCFVKLDKYGISAGRDESDFCNWPEPLMSYEAALKLIESVEPDAPEFDIKLLQPVLIRNGGANSFWNLAFFAAVKSNGIFTNDGYCREMIKLTGNESFMLEKTTPNGWWECENGKPVWRLNNERN
jgi:hypothetical protein